ncbi:protein moonraker [Takifugu rubripes]|uniref:protein moonraker n=1 Tax=Takifugu rubripes TaxID=31033 RepID=UPI001145F73F|nr:protein moonraker [Takifugu rubripes]
MSQTKLLFNEAIPAHPRNRAIRVPLPGPIVIENVGEEKPTSSDSYWAGLQRLVQLRDLQLQPRVTHPVLIERLLPTPNEEETVENLRSAVHFSFLSEERLNAAVKLAKRDLRRWHRESLTKSPAKASQEVDLLETTGVEEHQEQANSPTTTELMVSRAKSKPRQLGAKLSVQTPQKNSVSSMFQFDHSPPTRDPGSTQLEVDKTGSLSQEVQKLLNELDGFIQKVEDLTNRVLIPEEPLEPEEQQKLETRRQKQVAHSARIVYVLQQKVNEVQADVRKFQYQKVWENKKPIIINRLAALHRGTLRALRVIIHQLSDHGKVPSYHRELVHLIQQLSICSAQVKEEGSSALSESALQVIQKLEVLNSALGKQVFKIKRLQVRTCPPHRKSPRRSSPPMSAPRSLSKSPVREARKHASSRRDKQVTLQKPKTSSQKHSNRGKVLQAGVEWLVHQRELQREARSDNRQRKVTLQPLAVKHDINMKKQPAGFQQATVSSQLRVNHPPQKERSVPWKPISPHSPPLQRSPPRRLPEPRCLFSPTKLSTSQPKQAEAAGSETEQLSLSTETRQQAHREALREAWLGKMTMQRLDQLNQLNNEVTECVQKLRSEVLSPTQWAERAEQQVRERIQPLLDDARESLRNQPDTNAKTTVVNNTERAEPVEQLSHALPGDLVKNTWSFDPDTQLDCLQDPTLENMLLRIEEMQREQDEVRRRCASIMYSDPLFWDAPGGTGAQSRTPASNTVSPKPIRLTMPVLQQTPAANIILEKPVDTGYSLLSDNSLSEEASQDEQQLRSSLAFPGPAEGSRTAVISLPGSALKNIRRYRENYEAYLRTAAHEAVGSINPWAVADSLAEELLSEALAEVAEEFESIMGEYAEAVFTSEFLSPARSPPASVSQ